MLDCTWETPYNASYTSNIVKMARAIKSVGSDGVQQIAFYRDGYGVKGGFFHQYLGAAVGFGLAEDIRETYRFLSQNYEPGDEIYIYGYSRGAFQARSLAGLISLCGLLKSENLMALAKAWDNYAKSRGEESPSCRDIRRLGNYPVPIKILGVFDTVGNLGVPGGFITAPINRRFKFHNTRLHSSIECGLHALAIDECRTVFRPSLWTREAGEAIDPDQVVEQVWFPGSHGDVGGGFPTSALSDGVLMWMVKRTADHSGLDFNSDYLRRQTSADPVGPQHDYKFGIYFFDRFLPFIRLIRQRVDGLSFVRRKVLLHWRVGRMPSTCHPINEQIHESAIVRYGKTVIQKHGKRQSQFVYEPPNLKAALKQDDGETGLEETNVETAPVDPVPVATEAVS